MIWRNILLLSSKFRLINTRANKLWSHSRIIIFCHLCESEMQKWRWDRIHRYAWTSGKETSDRHTHRWHTNLPVPSPEEQKHPERNGFPSFFLTLSVLSQLFIFFLQCNILCCLVSRMSSLGQSFSHWYLVTCAFGCPGDLSTNTAFKETESRFRIDCLPWTLRGLAPWFQAQEQPYLLSTFCFNICNSSVIPLDHFTSTAIFTH